MLFRVAVTLLVGASLVSGCGFSLKGKVSLSDKLSTIYINGSNARFNDALKKGLRFSGAEIVSEIEAASAVVDVVEATYERKVRSVDSRGLATRYQLFYTVVFEARGSDGEVLLERNRVRTTRDVEFDSSQLLQKVNEEEFLREDMEDEMVQQIIRQLGSVAGRAGTVPVAARHGRIAGVS